MNFILKRYSPKLQRQWKHVYSTVFENLRNDGVSVEDARVRAVMAGNSVLKKRFKKEDSMLNNTRGDYFVHLVDDYLGNLKG